MPEERFSGGGQKIWRPFVSYHYYFSGVSVDTDSNKANIRKNLKHKLLNTRIQGGKMFNIVYVFKGEKIYLVKFISVEKGEGRSTGKRGS